MIIKNNIGWEDEYGNQLAYSKGFGFMNLFVTPQHRRPIWNDAEAHEGEGQ